MWQKNEAAEKTVEEKRKTRVTITDEIKEEEEGNSESEDEKEKPLLDSPNHSSVAGSDKDKQPEGDGLEDTFISLDEALNFDFDINKVTKLDQRLKDINRQPRARNELYPFRLQLQSKRVKKCKQCVKKIVAPGEQQRV